ncbi:Fis family transcriptional regulator [Acidithiobacillus ferriphilus]|uniref:Fis family transcriptional regulator n=1 Tax=Acidithiobacillus ferriphilus TaxID=1689834 RepID=UPI001D00D84C|nr:Fis family transcriptional regulator [Acidithiobacillus ferriphilus]
METTNLSLSDCVTAVMDRYLADLQGEVPSNLHAMIIGEVESAHCLPTRCSTVAGNAARLPSG